MEAKPLGILEAFILNDTKHEINIIWEDDEPLIKAIDIAKVLEIKNIHTSIEKFKPKHYALRNTYCTNGDHNVLYFTEAGLYKLLMISRKPIAETFQDWIEDVIKLIRKTGKYELDIQKENMEKTIQEQVQIQLKEKAEDYKNIEYKANHNALVEAYRNKDVVYFGYVKFNDDKVKIKIGSTGDIYSRSKTHTENFDIFYLFHVIESPMHKNFERFLHNHDMIKSFRDTEFTYIDKKDMTHKSIEVYDIEHSYIKTVIEVAKRNHLKFVNSNIAGQIIDNNKIELDKIYAVKDIVEGFNNIIENVKSMPEINIEPSTLEMPEIVYIQDTRKVTVGRGNKIQIYNPDTKELIHTFNCLVECVRENNILSSCSKPMIMSAIKTKTVYKSFRWVNLDRSLADDHKQDIGDSNVVKSVNIGFIAMLNLDKDKIEKVYQDMKSTSIDRKLKSISAISKAISTGATSTGHYFKMWDNCDESLKTDYLSRAKLPEKPSRVNSISINKLDPINKETIKTYITIEDIIKEYKISRKTIHSAIDNGYICKGFFWKILDDK